MKRSTLFRICTICAMVGAFVDAVRSKDTFVTWIVLMSLSDMRADMETRYEKAG